MDYATNMFTTDVNRPLLKDTMNDAKFELSDSTIDISTIAKQYIGIQHNSPTEFSSDGLYFAFVTSSHSLTIQKIIPSQQGFNFETHASLLCFKSPLHSVKFHPTKPWIFAAGNEGIVVYNYIEKTKLFECTLEYPKMHDDIVYCLTFVCDGDVLVSGSKDSSLIFWHIQEDGTFIHVETIQRHKGGILVLERSPNGSLLATAGQDSTIRLWDISSLRKGLVQKLQGDELLNIPIIAAMDGHRGDVVSLCWWMDGQFLFSGARDNQVKIWDVNSGRETRNLPAGKFGAEDLGHTGDVRRILIFNAQHNIVVTIGTDSRLKIWQLGALISQTSEFMTMSNKSKNLTPAEIEEFLLGQESVKTEDIRDVVLSSKDLKADEIWNVSFNPKFPLMIYSTSLRVLRIHAIPGNPVKEQWPIMAEFAGHKDHVTCLDTLFDDKWLLSGSEDYEIFIYDSATTIRRQHLSLPGSVSCMSCDQTRQRVYVGCSDYNIHIFGQEHQKGMYSNPVSILKGHSGRINAISVNPQFPFLVSGSSDFTVRLWSTDKNDKEPLLYRDHTGIVKCVKWSSDGRYLVTGGTDHMICVYCVENMSLKLIHKLQNAHSSNITALAFVSSLDDLLIISGSTSSEIKVWKLSELENPNPVIINAHHNSITDIKVAETAGQFLSASVDGFVLAHSIHHPHNVLGGYSSEKSPVVAISVVGDSKFAMSTTDGQISVWALKTVE
eukprot:TRINITY_DN3061_c1_g2_i3.p1 TRINITY_DN3061_c1_g2~~TRINITY_DN3061_c1_g2_i3.p1  ORF type:complete len:730 (+),score=162.46 TRINITY_DN3061_c1_g2_i3:29-2191(+)